LSKIKYFLFLLCLCLCQKVSIAEEQSSNWLNKKLLKLEVLSNEDQNSPIATNNQVVSSIALGELVEEKINLPYYYWSWSKTEDLTSKIEQLKSTTNPITRELIIAVLTSEMPINLMEPKEAKLYVTRLNKLLEFGQYNEAQNFINNHDSELKFSFNQQYTLNIIRGNDTLACSQLKIKKNLDITLKQKIYCLIYEKKFAEAQIIFETGKLFETISNDDKNIIEILLSYDTSENIEINNFKNKLEVIDYIILRKKQIVIPLNDTPTPLMFYDLSQALSHDKKLNLLEELNKRGIILNNKLFPIYLENSPSSNIETEKRKKCIVELEMSIEIYDSKLVRKNLTKCLTLFEKIGLSYSFSENYQESALVEVKNGWETPTSIKMRLLTKEYSKLFGNFNASSNFQSAQSIARNEFIKLNNISRLEQNIVDAFRQPNLDKEYSKKIDQGKIGEVIISSIINLTDTNLNQNQKGLMGLIQAGLEDTAKDIAINYLLTRK